MPTLSGWLLQYPVVYLARPNDAVVMAQLLSEAILVLHDVQIAGPFIQVGVQVNSCQSWRMIQCALAVRLCAACF